jgi:hypothetical protein
MIKRVVILQDEHLVVREIQASMQRRRGGGAGTRSCRCQPSRPQRPCPSGRALAACCLVVPGRAREPECSPEDDRHRRGL